MPKLGLHGVLDWLRRSVLADVPCGELLQRFIARSQESSDSNNVSRGSKGEDAFAELVRRHGPKVYGVCRRILGDHQLAEDAFQAAFVVLARRAHSIHPRSAVGGFLYVVARKTALKALAMGRRRKETLVSRLPDAFGSEPASHQSDILAMLDEEIANLSDSHRAAVVLCEIDGVSRTQAAKQLGIGEGTLSSRLSRAREQLRKRLLKRGVTLSAGMLAALAESAHASVPFGLTAAAAKISSSPLPHTVSLIAKGVLKAMILSKLKTVTLFGAATLLASSLSLGVIWAPSSLAGMRNEPALSESMQQKVDKDRADEAPAAVADSHGDPLPAGAIARLGTVRFRAANGIDFLTYSPDGKRLVSQSKEAICIWDTESGRKQIEFAAQVIGPLAWRTDGRGVMLIHEESGSIRIGDFTRDAMPKPPQGFDPRRPAPRKKSTDDEERIHTYAITPDGKHLLAGRTGNLERKRTVTVWELEPGKSLDELRRIRELGPLNGNCLQIIVSPDSTHAGVLSRSAMTKSTSFALYGLATGKETDCRTIVMPSVNDGKLVAALATKGRYLAVGGQDAVCHIYQLGQDGYEVTYGPQYAEPREFNGWSSMAFAGEYVVAAHGEQKRLYCLTAKTAFEETPSPSGIGFIAALAISPDGKRVATAGHAGIIRFWDIATGYEIEGAPGHCGLISDAQIVVDGTSALTWAKPHTGRYSVSGTNIPSREGDVQRRLWDLATGKEIRRFSVPRYGEPMTLAPDKKTLLARLSFDGPIRSFDVLTGATKPTPPAMLGARGDIQDQIGDGRSVVIVNVDSVGIWEWPEGQLRRVINVQGNGDFLRERLKAWLAPDGKRLLTRRRPGGVDVWDAESGKRQSRLVELSEQSEAIRRKRAHEFGNDFFEPDLDRGIAFLNHGRHVAYLENDPVARPEMRNASRLTLWDLETSKLLRTFERPGSYWSRAVAADPRGYTLATAEDCGMEKGFTLLYEVASGQIRRRLDGHLSVNTSVTFTPDGDRLVTVSGDSTGLVWDMSLKGSARGKLPANEANLDRAWNAMAEPNARAAFNAQIVFATNPEGAITLLRKRLRAATRLDEVLLDRLVADLESEKFAIRERATNELAKLGRNAIPAIRNRAAKVQSLETKRRLAQYLERHESGPLLADDLRAVRSLEFLEHIGTPAARDLIAELTKGEPTAELTIRAIAAKGRLDRRRD